MADLLRRLRNCDKWDWRVAADYQNKQERRKFWCPFQRQNSIKQPMPVASEDKIIQDLMKANVAFAGVNLCHQPHPGRR